MRLCGGECETERLAARSRGGGRGSEWMGARGEVKTQPWAAHLCGERESGGEEDAEAASESVCEGRGSTLNSFHEGEGGRANGNRKSNRPFCGKARGLPAGLQIWVPCYTTQVAAAVDLARVAALRGTGNRGKKKKWVLLFVGSVIVSARPHHGGCAWVGKAT